MSKPQISVIQLSTGHTGGAGLAARRLNQALNEININSIFYCLDQPDIEYQNQEYFFHRKLWRRGLSYLSIVINKKLSKLTHFSTISTNAVSFNTFIKLTQNKERILHFHNWQNLISQKNLLKLIKQGYPIVLTMHDERFNTGGCHYQLDCTNFLQGCKKCPRAHLLLQKKIKSNRKSIYQTNFSKLPNFAIISPSNWLLKLTRESLQISKDQIFQINNPLGPHWNSEGFVSSRTRYFKEKIKIGVATMSDNYVKHGEIISKLRNNEEFSRKYQIVFLREYDNSEKLLSHFWKEIDLLLALSRADNSPNSILEAKSLRIPVLTSKIGGIPELLGATDYALDPSEHTIDKIVEKIDSMIASQSLDFECRSEIQKNNLISFVQIYERILNY